jgi:hypothetical protein
LGLEGRGKSKKMKVKEDESHRREKIKVKPRALIFTLNPGLTPMADFQGIQRRFHLERRANSMFALIRLRFRNKILESLKAIGVSPDPKPALFP